MWTKFRVKLKFRDKMLAGLPRDPKALLFVTKEKELDAEAAAEVAADVEGAPEIGGCVFRRDDKSRIFVHSGQIKAAIKECCSTLGFTVAVPGLKNHIQHGLFVRPERLYFEDKEAPDDEEVKVGNVTGPQGPRSVIHRHEYVEGATLAFEVWVAPTSGNKGKAGIQDKVADLETWRTIFELAAENGLGASRSQGYGTFDVLELEKTAADA